MSPAEISVLLDGLLALDENALAGALSRARAEFEAGGGVSEETDEEIGERLWELDEKLVALLDAEGVKQPR